MSYSIVQSKVGTLPNGNTNVITITLNSSFTQGNLAIINVWQFSATFRTITNVQDQSNNVIPFTVIGNGASSGQHHLIFAVCENLPANITSVKVTIAGTATSIDAQVIEIFGLKTSSSIHAYSYQAQTNLTLATDAVSSGVMSVTQHPGIVFGATRNASGTPTPYTIGTGYRSIGESLPLGASEHKRIASTGTFSATFTPPQTGENHVTGAVVLLEAEDGLSNSIKILNNILPIKGYMFKNGTSTSQLPRIQWGASGEPAAGTVSSAIGGAVCTSSTTGAMYFYNSLLGKQTKISSVSFFSEVIGYFFLIDRLWECSVTSSGSVFSITSTSEQIINSIPFPLRDNNGSINGEGVYIALVSNGGWSGGTISVNLKYTNSSGTAGRVSSLVSPDPSANPTNGQIFYFGLQGNDIGVKVVESITITSTTVTSGTFHLIAFRPIDIYLQNNSYAPTNNNFADSINMPLFNNSCLTLVTQYRSGVAFGPALTGFIEYTSG